jgi:hypothetical protein
MRISPTSDFAVALNPQLLSVGQAEPVIYPEKCCPIIPVPFTFVRYNRPVSTNL